MAVCRQCSAVFTPAKTSNGFYCSNQHQKDFEFSTKFAAWLIGEQPFKENRSIRRALIHRDGTKCSCCGISDWCDKPITLEVEHKDGNSEDNTASNLCLLCPNCHSQTDTYKSKNRGNGRHARRQRYAEGKSY